MANFDKSGMTQQGINLMGKAIGGATIQFTKLVLGDGEMKGEIVDLQGVVSAKQNVDVTRIERKDNQCTVGGELLTSSVKQGFFWRECGLYAMDPDVGEILYNYAYSTKPDYIAASDSGMMEEILVAMVATVGSNTNVNITVDDSMVFATKKVVDKKPYYYNSIADMQDDMSLKKGDMAITMGYYTPNDGGNGEYVIESDADLTVDNGITHQLKNGLKALLVIKNNTVSVNQYGAKGDGITDDSSFISNCINNIPSNVNTINFGKLTYVIGTQVTISNSNITINGDNATILCNISDIHNIDVFRILNAENVCVKNFNVDGRYETNVAKRFITFDNCSHCHVENISCKNARMCVIFIAASDGYACIDTKIVNVTAKNISGPLINFSRYYPREKGTFKDVYVENCNVDIVGYMLDSENNIILPGQWGVGINYADVIHSIVNVVYSNCKVTRAWRCGFHAEQHALIKNCTFINCESSYNGVCGPDAELNYYRNGWFYTGDVQFINCVALENGNVGFYPFGLYSAPNNKLISCFDSSIGQINMVENKLIVPDYSFDEDVLSSFKFKDFRGWYLNSSRDGDGHISQPEISKFILNERGKIAVSRDGFTPPIPIKDGYDLFVLTTVEKYTTAISNSMNALYFYDENYKVVGSWRNYPFYTKNLENGFMCKSILLSLKYIAPQNAKYFRLFKSVVEAEDISIKFISKETGNIIKRNYQLLDGNGYVDFYGASGNQNSTYSALIPGYKQILEYNDKLKCYAYTRNPSPNVDLFYSSNLDNQWDGMYTRAFSVQGSNQIRINLRMVSDGKPNSESDELIIRICTFNTYNLVGVPNVYKTLSFKNATTDIIEKEFIESIPSDCKAIMLFITERSSKTHLDQTRLKMWYAIDNIELISSSSVVAQTYEILSLLNSPSNLQLRANYIQDEYTECGNELNQLKQ